MYRVSKEHVPAVTASLTTVSLALVFSAAGGVIPRSVLPTPTPWVLEAIPHVNAGLSAFAIVTISLGWYWIRRGEVERHRVAMLVSLVTFATFLTLYLYRLTALGGPTPFAGPEIVRLSVYLPVLAVHVLLAIVCIPLLYYVVLLAATHSVDELLRTRHAAVGRIAATLWIVSFGLGIVVYALRYHVY